MAKADVGSFLDGFVRPLVAGGEIHVGRPITIDDVLRFDVALDHASVESVAVDEARASVLSTVVCRVPAFVLEQDDLALAAALHNALFLSHPAAEGMPVTERMRRRIVETTQSLPTQGPGAVPNDASARGTNAADPATPASAASTPGDGAAGGVAPGPGQVSLQLRFSGDSWVEIFDGSGKAVLYDLGKTGSERTITATAPLSVTLGNAPAVAIAVNGRALPPPPAQGPVARFSIGADGTLR